MLQVLSTCVLFLLTSKKFTDIDECLDSGIQCGNHSQCVNTPGSYNCVCDVGFYRNGSQSLCYGKSDYFIWLY